MLIDMQLSQSDMNKFESNDEMTFLQASERKLENLALPNLNHLIAGVTIENYATFSCLSNTRFD